MLLMFHFMAELLQCFLDITRHRKVDLSSLAVPIEGYANVTLSGPITW
jgi:hypothetical protein